VHSFDHVLTQNYGWHGFTVPRFIRDSGFCSLLSQNWQDQEDFAKPREISWFLTEQDLLVSKPNDFRQGTKEFAQQEIITEGKKIHSRLKYSANLC
jgi:hypothetical protein